MSRALLVLDDSFVREKAKRWIDQAPAGTRVEYKAPKRSLEQNAMMWACLTEVADQVTHHGLKLTTEDWKLIFIDALKRENRIAPNLEGTGFVSLGRSTSDLSKEEMTDMIELILAFGAKNGVVFKDSLNSNPDDIPSSEDTASPVVSEPEGSAPSHASGSSISDETRLHLMDFARKGLRAAGEGTLSDQNIEDMIANYREVMPESDWGKLSTIKVALMAVIAGKRTVDQARSFIATDCLDCSVEEIGGVK